MGTEQQSQQGQQGQEVSFRGEVIPTIRAREDVHLTPAAEVAAKIEQLSPEEAKHVTVEAIRYKGRDLDCLKLSTGDAISLESGIALAENDLLAGYRVGSTRYGGKTLRALPDEHPGGLHKLPKF